MADRAPSELDRSVTMWIEGLKGGDERSAQQLWERYFSQLVQVANAKLPAGVRRDFDEEDVAISAFHSLCVGVQQGNFPRLDDRKNLWSLLVVITARTAMNRIRSSKTQKRGSGAVLGESVFLKPSTNMEDINGIHQIIGREPSPEFAAEVSEQCERLLALLPDESMRELALLKLQGHSNKDAADRLKCGLRTIERRLGLIRRIWEERG